MRATLFILAGRSAGRSFVVEDSAIIGREPSCQIRLADKSISRRHARILWDGFRWRVEDLDSRNGIHLDKHRVREANLADCDEFMLGEVPVRLRIEAQPGESEEEDFEFEDDFLADAPEPTGSTPPDAQPELELEEEITLEEEIDLGAGATPEPAPGLSLQRRPPGSAASQAQRAPVALGDAPASRLRKDLDPRAKLLAQSKSRGLLGGDLSQQPAWVLGLLFLVLGAGMLVMTYLIFQGVMSLQG